jgi:hypothetical protein
MAEGNEQRLQRLEDIEAIRALKARAGLLADSKYTRDHHKKPQEEVDAIAWEQARCFAPDGEARRAGEVVARGHDALFRGFRFRPWRFALHMYYNPIITVEGDRGHGHWVFWCLATDEATDAPLHVAGYIEDEYVRLAEGWRFQATELKASVNTGFGAPWTNRAGAIL